MVGCANFLTIFFLGMYNPHHAQEKQVSTAIMRIAQASILLLCNEHQSHALRTSSSRASLQQPHCCMYRLLMACDTLLSLSLLLQAAETGSVAIKANAV